MSNEIDEKLFKQIFGHNQIIVKNIKQNKEKLFEQKRSIG